MGRVLLACAGLLTVAASMASAQTNQGRTLYGEQCATCHGADGRGLNGPNLTNLFTTGNDDRVLQIIRNGVPGSIMPPSRNTDDEIRTIVGYLKVLAKPPESSAAYVRPNPDADFVTLTTNDGRVIHGVRRNEDAFSIQILESGGRLQGYAKSSLKNIVRGERAPTAKIDPSPGVTYRNILGGLRDPSRWMTFSGDYTGQRHSPLTEINPGERREPQA
jgi:cytochrome c553